MWKWVGGYWIVGCLIMGLADGNFGGTCLQNEAGTALDRLTYVATWPRVLTLVAIRPDHQPCLR